MKKYSFADYTIYYLAKGLASLFRLMPIRIALFFGRRLGRLSRLFNRKRYRIAYANLKAAFGPKYSPAQLKKILLSTYANIGQGLVEVLLLPKLDKRYVDRYITYEDFDFAEEVLKKGKGLIFLTAHFGNWEISSIALPLKGFTYTGIAKEQKPFLLNKLLNTYRESKGCKIILKGPGIKYALRALRENNIVGMLVDQDAGKEAVFTEFFGRDASWHRGVFEFAMKTGAGVIPGFAIRGKGPHIRFKVFKPIELPKEGTKSEITEAGFRQQVQALEAMIRDHPEQWLWPHRRWKSTPIRKVVILNDGRTGHLRQSEALLNKLRDIWVKKGYSREHIRAEIIDIDTKNSLSRNLLSLGPKFSCQRCQGCLRCLRLCLKRESYERVAGAYADIVISCGSSVAGVNLILSRESNARSVVIMKPKNISLKKFDLAVVPLHDNPPDLKNLVVTDGALNLISRDSMRLRRADMLKKTGDLRGNVIGLLVGGSTKDFHMEKRSLDNLLDGIIESAQRYDCDIVFTTSRRTPPDVEELLKARLSGHDRCRLAIIANEENRPGVVEGILALSNLALVSQESISMISEAASSSAHTIVFQQEPTVNKRHKAFLKNLSERSFIDIASPGDIHNAIANFFDTNPAQQTLNDASKVEEALDRLL